MDKIWITWKSCIILEYQNAVNHFEEGNVQDSKYVSQKLNMI